MKLLESVAGAESGLPLVLLHGWGQGADIWQGHLDALLQHHSIYLLNLPGYEVSGDVRQASDHEVTCKGESAAATETAALLQLAETGWKSALPEAYLLVGFSLGGAIATLGLQSVFANAVGLVTVATNGRFVAGDNWATAMPAEDFDRFVNGLEVDMEKTLKRFQSLQCRGAGDERRLLRQLKTLPACEATIDVLAFGLCCLQQLDLLTAWSTLDRPSLHQFGFNDSLVPVSAVKPLERNLGVETQVFGQSSHLPFATQNPEWSSAVHQFAASL